MNKTEKIDIKKKNDEYFMKEAIKEAKKAYQKNEVQHYVFFSKGYRYRPGYRIGVGICQG